MAGLTALIVEDDTDLRESLVALVAREGFATREASTLERARKLLDAEPADMVLLDLALPDGDGLDLLAGDDAARAGEVVVTTGRADAESVVRALRAGALDFLQKPVDRARLRTILTNVARTRGLKREVASLRDELRELGRFGALVGRSQPMREIYDLVARVAPTDSTVFVTGESGTGKELVAETVHRLSRRSEQPFVVLHCGGVSPSLIESELFGHEKGSFTGADRLRRGYFEQASGGTLFLDELTEMPIELQVKLLRVLETGSITRVGSTTPIDVDVRVVAASNREPHEAVRDGALREDLLYRLSVFPIELPPLRARGDDAVLLAEVFLDALNERDGTGKRLGDDAREALLAHDWPGNVRELKNAIERAAILSEERIDAKALPTASAPGAASTAPSVAIDARVGASIADVERRLILATLEAYDGDKKRSAEVLGISLKTLYNRLSVYRAREEG
ncbi:MAG: sigma-54-dependent Fis family transcriptional regulator [Myxococcales bacterium]|nr:sigma-54-dependent Fis family transcriptional regulator [Myxococcales bacterium]